MPQEKEKSWVRNIFSHLWGSRELQARGGGAGPPQERKETSQEPERQGSTESMDLPGTSTLSSSTVTIVEKLNALKKIFEFEEDLKKRTAEIRSKRELLIFMHDTFLFRFEKLREIGLIGAEWSSVFENLDEKFAAALSEQTVQKGKGASLDAQELLQENTELKQRIENLHAKYVKTGIVTDTELEKDKEIEHLQSRVREQQGKLRIASQRLKVLASYQEMVQSLKARLSLSNSKLEHQSRLLRSITAGNPRHQEMVRTVERLNDENKKLKLELERQSDLLLELRKRLPPEARSVVEGLIDRNARLSTDLDERDQQLEIVSGGGEGDLIEYIERLTEKNIQLKDMMTTQQSLDQYMKDQDAGKGDSDKIIEAMKLENQRLEDALRAKEAQIEVLSADPAHRRIMKAYSKLQIEYKQLFKENQNKDNLFQQERSEKQTLMTQTRERTALIRENQQLKAQLDSSKRLTELVKKLEEQCQALKKERSELAVKNERAMIELDGAKRKMAKMTAEHNVLLEEYQKLFENL
jgi:hypothetical protein